MGNDDDNASVIQKEGKIADLVKRKLKCPILDGVVTQAIDTTGSGSSKDPEVFIGFDTEWCRHPKRRHQNVMLAYGVAVVCGEKASSIVMRPSGCELRHRLSLGRLIGQVIRDAMSKDVLTQ